MVSYTEENYLKAIYKLSETSQEEIPINAIAESLEVKAGSVTDMLKKLAEKGLIQYTKYSGVTSKGKRDCYKNCAETPVMGGVFSREAWFYLG